MRLHSQLQETPDLHVPLSIALSPSLPEEMDDPQTPVMMSLPIVTANGYSPPDFDFSIPCRGFKSSFARSLSLSIASSGHHHHNHQHHQYPQQSPKHYYHLQHGNNNNCCRSLDFNVNAKSTGTGSHRSSRQLAAARKDCPPLLPQRLSCVNGSTSSLPPAPVSRTSVPTNTNASKRKHNAKNGASGDECGSGQAKMHENAAGTDIAGEAAADAAIEEASISRSPTPPPAIPARRTLPAASWKNAHNMQKPATFQRHMATATTLTHFRNPAVGNADIEPPSTVTVNQTINQHHHHQQQQQQQQQQTRQRQLEFELELELHQSNPVAEFRDGNGFRRNNNNNNVPQHVAASRGNKNNSVPNGDSDAIVGIADGHDDEDENEVVHGQACNSCNEMNFNTTTENEIIKTVRCESQAKATPALPPKQPLQCSLPQISVKAMSAVPRLPVPASETGNLENVILQNEVHTLRWQLKQMDTRCEMQRAVLEEMARFLDRYHSHGQQKLLEQSQTKAEQMARSKSLFHVNGGADSGRSSSSSCSREHDKENTLQCCDSKLTSAYLRTRSSTNLIDLNVGGTLSSAASTPANECGISDSNSYTAFKDYTWRRSPKKPTTNNRYSNTHAIDDVDAKLSQEAFRLSRTIHNLLNGALQQPLNTGRLSKAPSTASIMTLQHGAPNILNSTSLTMVDVPIGNHNHNSTQMPSSKQLDASLTKKIPNDVNGAGPNRQMFAAISTDANFLRANNFRDSRLSVRSSTDSSVHSMTSSSTDEDGGLLVHNGPPVSLMTSKQLQQQQHINRHQRPTALVSTTEDESGFSSISSFQEIGVPITPTVVMNCITPTKIALPVQLQVSHCWDASTSGSEDSVLWV